MQEQGAIEINLIDLEYESKPFNKTDFYNMDDEVVLNECLVSNADSICLFNANTIIEDDKLLNIAIKKYPFFLTKLKNYNEGMGLKILEKDIDLIMLFPGHFKTEKICKYVVSKKYVYLSTFPLEIISKIDNILQLMIISSPNTSIESIKEFHNKIISNKIQISNYIEERDKFLRKSKDSACCFIIALFMILFVALFISLSGIAYYFY